MRFFSTTTIVAFGATLALLGACKNFPEPKPGFAASSTSKEQSAERKGSGNSASDTVPLRSPPPPPPTYTETYERDPNRLSPTEARARTERDFEKMVNPKVLEMLRLLNAERQKNGLSTVVLEPRLMAAALREARDMAAHGHVSHEASDGSHMEDRIADVQYYYTKVAENIAATKATARGTFSQWVNSERHYDQMMITGATQAGIAYAYNPRRPRGGTRHVHYWVLLIARPHPFHD